MGKIYWEVSTEFNFSSICDFFVVDSVFGCPIDCFLKLIFAIYNLLYKKITFFI